jgi:hypothetical protein
MRANMLRMVVMLASSLSPAACSADEGTGNPPPSVEVNEADQTEGAMQIRIRAGECLLTARLEDSAAVRDFAALLPLRVTLKDYASTEKIADLPRQLSTEGAPEGVDADVGDIAYYAPWGNIALYYRDFGYSRGLVRLGRIDSGKEQLSSLEGPVVIEAAE